MKRVAFLSATCMQAGHPNARKDVHLHAREFEALSLGARAEGLSLEVVLWDLPVKSYAPYDAVVIGTAWNYAQAKDEFLRELERIELDCPLFNPLSLVRDNCEKSYLKRLADAGVATVPTLWAEAATDAAILEAFERFPAPELVIKPTVGAGSWRQSRLQRGAPLPPPESLPPAACMIQPFLPAAMGEGELSYIVIEGEISHGVRKVPAAGDYRVQAAYGAHTEVLLVDSSAEAAVAQVLSQIPEMPLYARVDFMRNEAGELLLMELELIEPYLYPETGPELGAHFGRALARRLRG